MGYTGFVIANLLRNPLRSALTGSAIALAVLLVCLLLTMPAGLDALLTSVASDTRVGVINKSGLVFWMPYSLMRKIRALDDVADAVGMVWFGGAFEEQGKVTFPSFAVEVEHIPSTYPDYKLAPEAVAAFARYRDGVIVGRQTMRKYGWKVGDRVTLRSNVWNVNLDLRIVGEIPRDSSPIVWINREYLDEAIKAQGRPGLGIVMIIWVRVPSPDRVNSVMLRIDELTRNTDYETTSQTEKTFFSNFLGSLQGFLQILLMVTALVSLCIVFIAANTASMAVRERAGEIGVLRAIGFRRRVIFSMLLAETVVLSWSAGAVGVGLAWVVTTSLKRLGGSIAALGPLGGFSVTPGVIIQGLVLSLAIGIFAGFAPAYGAARRPVADTLREVF
ncbi:MAG TPA: FtsX-like permease family protein [Myxococcota bacterium]|nr:FtsX-like permease family protein [Myxococcota bacterium]